MKKFVRLFPLLLIVICIGGCKKETANIDSSQPRHDGSLQGTWELRQRVGNIPVINYPAGNGSTITFSSDTYTLSDSASILFYAGSFLKEGRYYSMIDTSVEESVGLVIPSGQFTSRLIINQDTAAQKIFYQIADNQLTIMSGYFPLDGGVQNKYERVTKGD